MIGAPTRPVLRYHGGKWRLAPWVIQHFPRHQVYVEPFGGAASVLMRKPRSHSEVYNDLDQEIVNVFRVLRDPESADELARLLRFTPFARVEFQLSYQPSDDPLEQARRTIVRAFMGFGSPSASGRQTGFRASGRDNKTSPAGDWANYPKVIGAFTGRLQGVVIECRNAVEVIRHQDSPDTLFYVDPPYVASTRNRDTADRKGYRHELSDGGHHQLAEVLRSVRGMVVLSGYPCRLYDRELYSDWYRVERPALADGARERTEVLWLSPAALARGYQPRLMEASA